MESSGAGHPRMTLLPGGEPFGIEKHLDPAYSTPSNPDELDSFISVVIPDRVGEAQRDAQVPREAVDEIRAVGPAQLSLRELARRAGVSHAAPAHHFGDKRGLFTALAAEGFRLLHQRTTQVLRGEAALTEAGMRYVEFALGHPSHFAVMFDNSLLDADDVELVRARGTAFDVLY